MGRHRDGETGGRVSSESTIAEMVRRQFRERRATKGREDASTTSTNGA